MDGDDWIDRAAALARGLPPTRFDRLDADEQRRLREACRPGIELLGVRSSPGRVRARYPDSRGGPS